MFRRFALTALVLAMGGCATAPQTYDFPKSRVISDSKDVVWERVVEFFATNNLAIKTIEKDSGIIAADRMISSPSPDGMVMGWASCGTSPLETTLRQNIDLNVFVRPQGEAATNVTVNTRFNETRFFMDATSVHDCNSTGRLEAMILDAAQGR